MKLLNLLSGMVIVTVVPWNLLSCINSRKENRLLCVVDGKEQSVIIDDILHLLDHEIEYLNSTVLQEGDQKITTQIRFKADQKMTSYIAGMPGQSFQYFLPYFNVTTESKNTIDATIGTD